MSGVEVDVEGFVDEIVDELDDGDEEVRDEAMEIASLYNGIEEAALSTLMYAAEQGSFDEYAERLRNYAEEHDLKYDHPEKLAMEFNQFHHKFFDELYDDLGVEVPTEA